MFYIYDGSFEGFLSAVTMVMRTHSDIGKNREFFYGIVRENDILPLLEYQTVPIIPGIMMDFGDYILRHFGEDMTKTIYHAFLSEAEGIENAIVSYIFLARQIHGDPIDQLYHDYVKKVADAAKKVTREAHHYLGLLRFRKKSSQTAQDKTIVLSPISPSAFIRDGANTPCIASTTASNRSIRDGISSPHTVSATASNETEFKSLLDDAAIISSHPESYAKILNTPDLSCSIPEDDLEIYIAEFEPVTCALPLIADHFVERFPNQAFLILDRKRKICVIHLRGSEWSIKPYHPDIEDACSFDMAFEDLWKAYFKVLAIPERINPKLQMGNMPKRYWKYLVENPGAESP